MRISDWSSDVCSSDLRAVEARKAHVAAANQRQHVAAIGAGHRSCGLQRAGLHLARLLDQRQLIHDMRLQRFLHARIERREDAQAFVGEIFVLVVVFELALDQIDERRIALDATTTRSEEHTSELQSLMRSSYAVFCLTQKKT